ncbi:MAG: hypothetical protein Kow0059_04810 [Candidatus Sumerlaeia bacterium]
MKKCQACGFCNTDREARCLRCGAVLDTRADRLDGLPYAQAGEEGTGPRRKASGGPERRGRPSVLSAPANLALRAAAGARRGLRALGRGLFAAPLPGNLSWRQPLLAGVLGVLVPGLGQLYNHRWKKAFWVAAGWGVGAAVAAATFRWEAGLTLAIGSLGIEHRFYLSNVILFLWGMFVLWAANDAFVDACLINGQRWTGRDSWALFFAEIFSVGALAVVIQFFGSPVVKFISVRQGGFEPTLRHHDRVIVEALSYWFREPRRGDVVLYNPGRFTIERPGGLADAVWVINEQRSFERVLGLPGDVLERRAGRLFLNGQPLPDELGPLGSEFPLAEFRLQAPPGHYILVFSHTPTDAMLKLLGQDQPPRLDAGWVVKGWEEVCVVAKKDIYGRAVAVYQPPPHRRWLGTRNKRAD